MCLLIDHIKLRNEDAYLWHKVICLTISNVAVKAGYREEAWELVIHFLVLLIWFVAGLTKTITDSMVRD